MKKFQFLTAAGVALVLASCSSDTPDYNPQPGPAENTGDMYITLNLGNPSTRADYEPVSEGLDAKGESNEYAVKNLRIALYADQALTTQFYSNFSAPFAVPVTGDLKDADSGYTITEDAGEIKIKVSSDLYNQIKGAGTIYYVVSANSTKESVLKDNAEAITNKIDNTDFFTMGGTGNFTVETTQGDGSKENPLVINTTGTSVTLTRSAAKLNFTSLTDDLVKSTKNQSLSMTFVAAAIFNENDQEYVFPHYYDGASTPAENGVFSIFESSTEKTFISYPHNVFAPVALSTGAYNYGKGVGLEENAYICPLTHRKQNGLYQDVTYLAFQFELAGSQVASYIDAEGTDDYIYSYKGVLVGNAQKLKTGNAKLTSDQNAVLASLYAKAVTSGDVDNYLSTADNQPNGFYAFPKNDQNNYDVYYFHPIQSVNNKDKDKVNTFKYYTVLRNHIYNISINDLVLFGYPATKVPVNIIEDPEVSNYIQLNFNVANWKVLNNAYDLQ